MKINASQLDAFFTIAKLLNFTRAAEELHVTQSALSQRIAKLEEDLEASLFIRDRGALRLTEAGEQVLRFCHLNSQAEAELLSRLKDSNDGLAGRLKIGGFSSVNRSLVIPALEKLMRGNPKLSLSLITKELRELPALLKSAEVDYVLTTRESESAEIESIFLGFEDNILVQSKNNPPGDIYLDHDERDPTTKAYCSQNKVRFKPESMRYLDDVYGLLDGAKNGLGKAVLPLHLIGNEKDLEILHPQRRLVVPVYLNFYVQAYYRKSHSIVVKEIRRYFKGKLRQQK